MDPTDEQIERAVAVLRAGNLVAFPTETVYGLGADASNVSAIRKVFAAKQRPVNHPLIVHLADTEALKHWASVVPREAWLLAETFWPGPLTMVLPRAAHVPRELTGGQNTIALRVPSHPVARRLLMAFEGALAAPSANRFGRLSPTSAVHVREELGDAVDFILDGGDCPVGIESTIVAFRNSQAVVLRPGAVTADQIGEALQSEVVAPTASSPRVSGTLPSHYAPRTPLKVVSADNLEEVLRRESAQGPVAVLARRGRPEHTRTTLWQVAPDDAAGYAHHLYSLLRRIDGAGCHLIIAEAVPDSPEWTAIRDRLMRGSVEDLEVAAVATGT
ncbi:MAG: threonylcarbamoyl-AMP synthase [Betaproteobacteria bacterium]|nr:MAG: threonylcarbamoyl-AMP synthase [Betaproteobacteria bacterium]